MNRKIKYLIKKFDHICSTSVENTTIRWVFVKMGLNDT